MTEKPRRLGRGLEALLGVPSPTAAASAPSATADPKDGIRRIAISEIQPNPTQPRKSFSDEELAELSASIERHGLLQPIVVRPAGKGFQLIAGERRFRAASRLGWTDIPAVIREADDTTLLTLALIENLQRSDLNPMEEAMGYHRLIDEFGLTQQQVAESVGKDRSTVANLLRLLKLPATVRRMVEEGHLSLGHARALLALDDQRAMAELAREVIAHGLSVRDVERRARASSTRAPRKEKDAERAKPAEATRIEQVLRRRLQTDVKLAVAGGGKGTITMHFYSADDLERLLDLIVGAERERL